MNTDNRIFDIFSRAVDILLLNFLFILTSLPVITIGASLTALYSVTLKMAKNEESYIAKSYFKSFKENFLPATGGFLFLGIPGMLMGINIFISLKNAGTFYLVLRSLSLIFSASLYICFLYFFPVLARFKFTLKQVFLHIPHMIFSQLPQFFLLTALQLPVLFLCFYSVYTGMFLLIFACICGVSLFALIQSSIFRKIFSSYELQ